MTQLAAFKRGEDFGTAKVYTDAAGMNHVLIGLGPCDTASQDVFRLVDDPST